MNAPTEAEIREALEAYIAKWPETRTVALDEAVMGYADGIRWRSGDVDLVDADYHEGGDGLWRDLRPSECVRLRTLLYEAEQRATVAAHETILREYVAAALTFADEHPDAPRSPAGYVPD